MKNGGIEINTEGWRRFGRRGDVAPEMWTPLTALLLQRGEGAKAETVLTVSGKGRHLKIKEIENYNYGSNIF